MNPIFEFIFRKSPLFVARANKIYKEHFADRNESHGEAHLGASESVEGDFQSAQTKFGTFEEIGENPFVKQAGDNSCAVKSQQLILKKFGIDIPESDLAAEAELNGWFDPLGGTSVHDVGKLLEAHGVAVNRFKDANIFSLQNELCRGHQVIVSVDSDELWYGIDHQDFPDHALIVSSIDTSDVENPQVVLTDPGTGCVEAYPWSRFADAWEDGRCFMCSTKNPPPLEFAPELVHFDYEAGTIPDCADFSYAEFLAAHGNEIVAPDTVAGGFTDTDFSEDVPASDAFAADTSDFSGFSDDVSEVGFDDADSLIDA